jgi:uncharacterized alkaline shock family protein YloU
MESKLARIWLDNIKGLEAIDSNINEAIKKLLETNVNKPVTIEMIEDRLRVIVREELERVKG